LDGKWFRNRFLDWKRTVAAWPAGNCPLAETINGWERDPDSLLVEPRTNLAVSPMLATQGEMASRCGSSLLRVRRSASDSADFCKSINAFRQPK